VDDVIGEAGLPVLASCLTDPELMLMCAEEPATFAVAERDAAWRKAMLEEMRSIEANQTWELLDPLVGCRLIGLKWVCKVKMDEHGDVVKHKARLVAR